MNIYYERAKYSLQKIFLSKKEKLTARLLSNINLFFFCSY